MSEKVYKIDGSKTRLVIRTKNLRYDDKDWTESDAPKSSTVSYINALVYFEYRGRGYSEAVHISDIMEVSDPGEGTITDIKKTDLSKLNKAKIDELITTAIEKRVKEIDKELLQESILSDVRGMNLGYPMDV